MYFQFYNRNLYDLWCNHFHFIFFREIKALQCFASMTQNMWKMTPKTATQLFGTIVSFLATDSGMLKVLVQLPLKLQVLHMSPNRFSFH